MSAPFRDFAGLCDAERPALSWWQRFATWVLPAAALHDRSWYRAHVGGTWELRCYWLVPCAPSQWVPPWRLDPGATTFRLEAREVYPYAVRLPGVRVDAGVARPPEERPALSWWQRAAVWVLGDDCAHWRWYRAHIGGAWRAADGDDAVDTEVYPYPTLPGKESFADYRARIDRENTELPEGREVYWLPSSGAEPDASEIARIDAHNEAVRAARRNGET